MAILKESRGLGCIVLFVAGATLTAGSTLKFELEFTDSGSREQAIASSLTEQATAQDRPSNIDRASDRATSTEQHRPSKINRAKSTEQNRPSKIDRATLTEHESRLTWATNGADQPAATVGQSLQNARFRRSVASDGSAIYLQSVVALDHGVTGPTFGA